MRLVIEELGKELPQGWVMLRRTPNTDPADGFIEMHFTGDIDLIAENAKLKRVRDAAEKLNSTVQAHYHQSGYMVAPYIGDAVGELDDALKATADELTA